MKSIVALLHEKLHSLQTGSGIYMLERRRAPSSSATSRHNDAPHTAFPNPGICGAAAYSGQKQFVVDGPSNSDSRYLACSLETKSEIVVPF